MYGFSEACGRLKTGKTELKIGWLLSVICFGRCDEFVRCQVLREQELKTKPEQNSIKIGIWVK